MVKNNHFHTPDLDSLERHLLDQEFGDASPACDLHLRTALHYCRTEFATAVMSDLRTDRSVICHGAFSETMGLGRADEMQTIDSIWEEAFYARIHPDDLRARHLLELQLFLLLKRTPPDERLRYRTQSVLRMADAAGRCRAVLHRTFYLANDPNGSLRLALCLYNFAPADRLPQRFEGFIEHMTTGTLLRRDSAADPGLLTRREKELMEWISRGLPSKQIAERLSISRHTVDRHRQNILEKLRCHSMIEALAVARELGLLRPEAPRTTQHTHNI